MSPPHARLRSRSAVRSIPAVLAVLLLASCASTPPPVEMSAPGTPTAIMQVLSIPKGCVVEMNGEYLGATPLEVAIPVTPDRRWPGAPNKVYSINVSTADNRAAESKQWRGGDPVPYRVLFRPPYAYRLTQTPATPPR